MHFTNTPNCHLETILVPEPFPHLKLFVVAVTLIHAYMQRIRPLRSLPLSLRGNAFNTEPPFLNILCKTV